jgi:hypothetical protein
MSLLSSLLVAAQLPLTVAEESKFTRTSTSDDVERLVAACCNASPKLTRLVLAKSANGREVPLVLVAEPPLAAAAAPSLSASLEAARASGKLVVLVMANIHAGEVEGKEAEQILLREFASGEHADLLAKLVVAFVPNYNPDGNDAMDRRNRPDQNGPVEGVGQRANGQGLDLNRDYVKCEASETRGLLAAVNALDAALVMDLHTTDGSFHGYDLTYAGAMHPASDPQLLAFTRETLLPTLRTTMRSHGFETFDYGDFADQAHPEKGWSTFDARPRFGSNYFGLGNRVTLLSEAYSHDPFEKRVRSTRQFVLDALAFAAAHADELRALRRGADERAAALAPSATSATWSGAKLPTRAEMATTRKGDSVLVGSVREEKDAVTGLVRQADSDESHPVTMDVHVSFDGRDEERLPLGWAVSPASRELEALLELHGVATTRLEKARRANVRRFVVDTREEAAQPFQGHRLVTLRGHDEDVELELPRDTLVVLAAQPRARLAFALLEPRFDDGLATWGVLSTTTSPAADSHAPVFAALRLVTWSE